MPCAAKPRPIKLFRPDAQYENYCDLFGRLNSGGVMSQTDVLDLEVQVKSYELQQRRASNVVDVEAKRQRRNARRRDRDSKRRQNPLHDPDVFCDYDPNGSVYVSEAAAFLKQLAQ